MKKTVVIFLVFSIIFLSLGGLFLVIRYSYLKRPSSTDALPVLNLKQEEIAGLVKPAVVRIVQEVKGEAVVPTFSIDFKTLSVIPRPDQGTIKIPVNEKISGSGFVVSQDGYILTNAHVVSYQTAKLLVAESVLERVLTEGIYEAIANDTEIPTDNTEERGKKLGEQVMEYILSKSQFSLNKTITVLNPSSQRKDDIVYLISTGFPAKIVSVSDTFEKDNKDVALIKISENNLPSVKLATANELSPGQKVYVFGFPGSAEFNSGNLIESTFTQGTVGAIKNSRNGDFHLYQTDAKVSQGSSGGPMVNDKGEVVGLITYQSSELQRNAGDNFAFAIPTSIVEMSISNSIVSSYLFPKNLNSTVYYDVVLEGIRLQHGLRAKQSIARFQQAKAFNSQFLAGDFLNSFITDSQLLIDSKQSVDTAWDEKMFFFKGISGTTWIVFSGIFLIIFMGVVIVILLIGKVKKDEEEIEQLESYLEDKHTLSADRSFDSRKTPRENQYNRTGKIFKYPENLGTGFETEEKDSVFMGGEKKQE